MEASFSDCVEKQIPEIDYYAFELLSDAGKCLSYDTENSQLTSLACGSSRFGIGVSGKLIVDHVCITATETEV